MSDIIKAVVINDLHFGIEPSQRLYNELHQFKDFLTEHKDIQLCVIDGDYFDTKLSLTDTATFLAISFFQELVAICKKQNIVLRMVQGTLTHERNQLQIFNSYESDPDLNFRIIRSVQDEDLFGGYEVGRGDFISDGTVVQEKTPGLHVLYLPEEYPENAEEYYKEFKAPEKRYNVIFGHGSWDFVSFQSQIEHGAQTATKSAPVFIYDEWKHTIPNGFISFGHIHGRNTYGKKIFYCGSFTRWGYGERSARGFTYFEYDLDKLEYKVEYIDNIEAPVYDAISTKSLEGIDLNNQDIQTIQSVLDEQIKKTDFLEIDLSGLSKENIALLKKVYAQNPNVKIVVKEKPMILKESKSEDDEFKKYQYITKKELPLDKTIQKFVKEDLGKDLDISVINEILKKE